MKTLKLTLLLLGLLTFQSSELHKFYISQTNMWYNFDTFTLEIISDLFVDDFEKTIEQNHGTKLYLGTDKEHPHADSLIFDYFKKHFVLQQEDTLSPLHYVGKEVKTDHLLIYVVSKNFKDDKKLEVKITFLSELFEEQVNRVNYENEDVIESASLTKDQTSTTFKSPY